MGENRLIFAFQGNIVKNKKKIARYYKWFELAELSKNKDNKEEDFLKYKKDKNMEEVLNRIRKDKLSSEEFEYVSDIYRYELYMKMKEEEHLKLLEKQKKRLEKKASVQLQQAEQKVEQEKQKAEQLQNKLLRLIKILLNQGDSIPSIASALELSVEETTDLVKLIQK